MTRDEHILLTDRTVEDAIAAAKHEGERIGYERGKREMLAEVLRAIPDVESAGIVMKMIRGER